MIDKAVKITIASRRVDLRRIEITGYSVEMTVRSRGDATGVPMADCAPRSSYPPSDRTVEQTCFNVLLLAVVPTLVIS